MSAKGEATNYFSNVLNGVSNICSQKAQTMLLNDHHYTSL